MSTTETMRAEMRATILQSASEIGSGQPVPIYVGKRVRALCFDGVIRSCAIVAHADTFFSIPARVQVRGRTVAGYLSVSTIDGWDTPSPDDPAVLVFRAYRYRKNADALPETPIWRSADNPR